MATFDFRILLETVEGVKSSYMSQSFVDTSQELVLSASQAYNRITGSVSCSYQNQLVFSGSNLNTSKTFKNNLLLSSSLQGGVITGSIDFTATTGEYDRLLRYKFFGEKVCNVLGLPHAQWVYVDQFSLNSDNDNNFFEGNVNAQNLFVGDSLTLANDSTVNSDIPFLINTGSDRHVKFIDERGFGSRALIIGYDKDNDTYEVSGSQDNNFNIGGVDKLVFADGTIQTSAGGGGSGVVAGVDTTVQFNDGGNFGGDAGFTYNKTTDSITLAGGINAKGDISSSGAIHAEAGNYIYLNSPDTSDDRIRYNSATGILLQSEKVTIDTDAAGVDIVGHITGSANLKIAGNLIVAGEVQATSITSSRVTASVVYASGSNIFGDELSDTHTFNGHITASGNISASGTQHIFGGSVGIGTSSPAVNLHVSDTAGSNTLETIRIENSNGYGELGVQSTYVRLLADGNLTYAANNSQTLLSVGGATKATLNSSGLNVDGHITASGDISASVTSTGSFGRIEVPNNISLGDGGGASARFHIDVNAEDNQPALLIEKVSDQNETALVVNHATSATTRGIADFQNSAGSKLYIRGDGNVGIGLDSPDTLLHITGANNVNLLKLDAPKGNFIFKTNSTSEYTSNLRLDDTGMDIGHDSSARALNLQTNNADRLTILGGGNVGIGTTSPGYPLDVTSTNNIGIEVESSYAGPSGVRVKRTSGDSVSLLANYSGFGGGLSSTDALRFTVNDADADSISSPAMYIETDGNIRISTDDYAPSHLLDISGSNVNGEMILVRGHKSYGGTIRYQRGTSYSWRAGVGGGSSTNSNIPSSYWGIEDVSDSNQVALVAEHSTQFVGIRNLNPAEALDVSGSINVKGPGHITASGNISASGTIIASKFTSAGGSGELISFNDNLTVIGNITSSGNISASGTQHSFGTNVGIGTVINETYKSLLSISSGSKSTSQTASAAPGGLNQKNNYLELYEQTSGSSEVDSGPTLVFSSNYYNNDILKTTRAGIRGGTQLVGGNASGFLAFHTNLASPANNMPERMRIDRDGNVGIGTTDPNNPLSVSGSLTVFVANQTSRLTVGEADASGESTSNSMIIETTGASNKSRIFTVGTSNDMVIETMGNNSDIHLSSDRDIRFGVNNNSAYNFTEKMIMKFDGKLGIGTSDPTETLELGAGNRIKVVDGGRVTGSILALADDHDVILSTENDSAAGDPQQFVLQHNDGETELINRRGDLILSASTGRIGIGTDNPQEALEVSGSGIKIHNGNSDGTLKFFRYSGEIGRISSANARFSIKAQNNKNLSLEDDAGNIGFFLKDGGNVMIGSTNTPSEKLEVDGNIKTRGNISSPTFVSGFAGSGYRITSGSTGKQSIEIDDLTVRGSMSIYELLIHQIRATNGSLFISNIGKVDSASRAGTTNVGTTGDNGTIFTIFFDTGSGTENLGTGGHSFLPGDIIRAQRFAPNANGSGSQIMVSDAEVTSVVNQKEAVVTVKSGTSHPTASFEYVRIGNTGSADRQGSIFMTSDDQNAPYIDVIDGVISHSNFNSTGTTKVRMGKLTGITTTTFGTLPGYGFYASGSAFLEGSINATNGSIGGFTITNSHISASGLLMQSSGKITASAVDLSGKITATRGQIGGFTIDGHSLTTTGVEINDITQDMFIDTDNFDVDHKGNITASNVDLTGKITATSGEFAGGLEATHINATSGSIGGFKIDDTSISSSNGALRLKSNGQITGSNVQFLSGEIANWTVGTGRISAELEPGDGTPGKVIISSTSSIGINQGHIYDEDKNFMKGFSVRTRAASNSWNFNMGEVLLDADGTTLSAGGTGSYAPNRWYGINVVRQTDGHHDKELFVIAASGSNNAGDGFQARIAGWSFDENEFKSSNLSGGGDGTFTTAGILMNKAGYISAPAFSLSSAGNLTISGTLSSSIGNIGGFTIGASDIKSIGASGNTGLTLKSNGQITGSGVLFTGGDIAGFDITTTEIAKNNITMSNANGGKITLNNGTTFLSGSGEGQFADGKISFDKNGNVTITDAELSLAITTPPSEFFDVANSKFVCLISGSDGKVDATINYGTFESNTTITILGTGSNADINRPLKETIFVEKAYTSGSITAASLNFGDIIEADKPITLVESADGVGIKGKEGTPLNFAAKQFLTFGDRNHPLQVMIYSPFAKGAVTMSVDGNNANPQGGSFVPFISASIEADGTLDLRSSGSLDSGENIVTLIESTVPIVAQSVGTRDDDNSDAHVLMPLDSIILNPDPDEDRKVKLDGATTIKTFTAVTASNAPTALVTATSESRAFHHHYTSSNSGLIQYVITGDGTGADSNMGIGSNTIGDTYIIPHAVGGLDILSIEPAIISCSIMNGDGTLTNFFNLDHRSASISSSLGFSTGSQQAGYDATGVDAAGQPKNLSSKGLYIEGTGNFALRTNTVGDDEYNALGYRRNTRTTYNQNVNYFFEPANTTTIIGDRIKTGKIQSNNFSTTAGSEFNLNDGTFKLGGSSDPTLQFNGTSLKVSGSITASSGIIGGFETTATQISSSGLLFKAVGQITMSGGTLTTTKLGGGDFIEIDGVDNDIKFFQNNGETVRLGKLPSVGGKNDEYGIRINNNEARVSVTKTSNDFSGIGDLSTHGQKIFSTIEHGAAVKGKNTITGDTDANKDGLASVVGLMNTNIGTFNDTGIFAGVFGKVTNFTTGVRSAGVVGINSSSAGNATTTHFASLPAQGYGVVSVGDSLISGSLNLIDTGHITASGNISSSKASTGSFGTLEINPNGGGDIYGNHIRAISNFGLKDSGGTYRHFARAAVTANELEIGNSNFTHIKLTGNITASSQIKAFGYNTFQPTGNTTPTDTPILSLRRGGGGGDNGINFFADASANYIIADDPSTNQKNLIIAAAPTGDDNTDRDIVFQAGKTGGSLIERMRISGTGNITASGNISSSGNLIGNQLIVGGGTFTSASLAAGGSGGGSGDITSVVAGTGMTGGATSGDATLNVIGGTGVTANADDIAIGQDVATTANVTFNNVIASGTISASGKITGDDFLFNLPTDNGRKFKGLTNRGVRIEKASSGGWAMEYGFVGNTGIDLGGLGALGGAGLTRFYIGGHYTTPIISIQSGSANTNGMIIGDNIGQTLPAATLDVAGNLQVQSHITASGNISASSGFIGNSYTIGTQNLGTFISSDTIMSLASANKKTQINGTNIKLNAPVTASGNISASGTLISNEIDVRGHITASGNISGSSTSTFKIGGKLQAGSKSFLIDRPEGGKLEYGALEGQQNDVFFRGELKGDNTIYLPQEWEWLVDTNTITTQLTSIGQYQELFVKEIKENKIFIDINGMFKTKENIHCYYIIHGTRKDIELIRNYQ